MDAKQAARAVVEGPKRELVEAPATSATAGSTAPRDTAERGLAASPPSPALPARALPETEPLTPEEMYRVLTSRTAFQEGVRKERLLGHGSATRALLQVLDRDGNRVTVEFGRNDGKVHAEEHAVSGLRRRLAGMREALKGGRLVVVVNQHVCRERCAGVLRQFAEEFGLDRVDSHVFVRESVNRTRQVRPRQTFSTQTNPSVEGLVLTRKDEPIYQRPASAPTPTPAPTPAGGSATAGPEGVARRLWKTGRSYGAGVKARARNSRRLRAQVTAGLIVAQAERATMQAAEDQAVETLQKALPGIEDYRRSHPGRGVLVVSAFHKLQMKDVTALTTRFLGQSLVLGASTEEEARELLERRRRGGQIFRAYPGSYQDYHEEHLVWIPPL